MKRWASFTANLDLLSDKVFPRWSSWDPLLFCSHLMECLLDPVLGFSTLALSGVLFCLVSSSTLRLSHVECWDVTLLVSSRGVSMVISNLLVFWVWIFSVVMIPGPVFPCEADGLLKAPPYYSVWDNPVTKSNSLVVIFRLTYVYMYRHGPCSMFISLPCGNYGNTSLMVLSHLSDLCCYFQLASFHPRIEAWW